MPLAKRVGMTGGLNVGMTPFLLHRFIDGGTIMKLMHYPKFMSAGEVEVYTK